MKCEGKVTVRRTKSGTSVRATGQAAQNLFDALVEGCGLDNPKKSESSSEWCHYEGLPPEGIYNARMDEDDEVIRVRVSDGSAYVEPKGNRRLFMNYQWKKVGDL